MTNNINKSVLCLIALSLAAVAQSEELFETELEGPNVCKKQESYNVAVTTTELQFYQERTYSWCMRVPPRCSKYKIKDKLVNKTQYLTKTRVIKECCDGYIRNNTNNGCIPLCTPVCQRGLCVAPDKCKCEHGYGGPACDIICRCMNNSSCDAETGKCICSKGWTGDDCSEPCPHGFYGNGCKEKCPDIIYGNNTCDHISGEVICRAGYRGIKCDQPCTAGKFGPRCSYDCSCEHGGECDHVTGQCQCLPGWMGPTCSEACPEGFYGLNCSQRCRCQNEGRCRKNDGKCICKPGWMHTHCETVCPEGFYGQHCMQLCNCLSQNFVCHSAEGCICGKGYTGSNCDILSSQSRVQELEIRSSRAGLAWGLVFAIIFVSAMVAIVFYYRRRVSNLKTEIQHVHFISDPHGSFPDRHNFDNPVYGLQGPNTRLLNNLRPKLNNLDRSTCSEYTEDNSNASGRAGTYSVNYNREMLQKNLTADLTNPIVYNSLEDALKEEHVYDEIKHKEGLKDPDEYDHLDYSRASTSHKPHYHRMNETILNINSDEDKPSNLKTMEVLLDKKADNIDDNGDTESCRSICDNTELATALPSPNLSSDDEK